MIHILDDISTDGGDGDENYDYNNSSSFETWIEEKNGTSNDSTSYGNSTIRDSKSSRCGLYSGQFVL